MKQKFTTTFDAATVKKLKKQAIDDGVDVNALIEKWILEHEEKKAEGK